MQNTDSLTAKQYLNMYIKNEPMFANIDTAQSAKVTKKIKKNIINQYSFFSCA